MNNDYRDFSIKNSYKEFNQKEGIRYKVIKHSNKSLIGLEDILLDWNRKYVILDLEMPSYSFTPDGEQNCITYQPYRFSKDCLVRIDNKTNNSK